MDRYGKVTQQHRDGASWHAKFQHERAVVKLVKMKGDDVLAAPVFARVSQPTQGTWVKEMLEEMRLKDNSNEKEEEKGGCRNERLHNRLGGCPQTLRTFHKHIAISKIKESGI